MHRERKIALLERFQACHIYWHFKDTRVKLATLSEHRYKAVVAIIYDEHANVLLGKASNNDDRNGKWCFPAGHIKLGECPGAAAARECFEETGYTAKPQSFAFSHPTRTNVGFVVLRKLNGSMKPNEEFSELRWVPWNKVPEMSGLYYNIVDILNHPEARFP